jgi:hypothetical protein
MSGKATDRPLAQRVGFSGRSFQALSRSIREHIPWHNGFTKWHEPTMNFMSLSHFAGHFWTYSVWSLEFLFVMPQMLLIFLTATVSLAIAFWKQGRFRTLYGSARIVWY